MGKEHWEAHARKPDPVVRRDLADNLMLVVRERPGDHIEPGLRFVATVRYKAMTTKGKWVVTYHYGSTAIEAERKVLELLRGSDWARAKG